jgi:hypothetical protein
MAYKPVPQPIVDAFRWYIHTTPTSELPSPHSVTHAFDAMPESLRNRSNPMTKLFDALRQKYKTPEAAMRALGLDAQLLKSKRKALAHDDDLEDDPRYRREQEEGDDENFPEGVAPRRSGSLQASEEGEDDDLTNNYPELAQFLRAHGFSDDEIAEACAIAHEAHRMTMDEPPPFRGRPRVGGGMDPLEDEELDATTNRRGATDSRLIFKRDGVMDSRNVALAFASRIACDNSVPVQHFGSPAPQSKQARKELAADAARSSSSGALADTYSRFPMLAHIGRA